jgi:hypothetical protein
MLAMREPLLTREGFKQALKLGHLLWKQMLTGQGIGSMATKAVSK